MPEGYRLRRTLSTLGLALGLAVLATGWAGCKSRPATEQTVFQKVTGDDPEEDRRQWDLLFNTQEYVFGKEAAAFVKLSLPSIPVGKALDIAMGEGRNAVYLAKKGFQVTGVDLSEVAIRKAKLLAREQGVQIGTVMADLQQYQIRPESYDLILNIQYLQRSLIPQIKAGLKRGGYVVFENPTVEELARNPGRNLRRDFLLEKGELRRLFSDLEIIEYSEAPGESGEIVARLVARRR